MCGACGRSVVSDPVLGTTRTIRQHLIVAQTVNGLCKPLPGAPKVAATSDGWLVSGPTGAMAAVTTVEALWSAVFRSIPGARPSVLQVVAEDRGASGNAGGTAHTGGRAQGNLAGTGLPPEDLPLRVLELGRRMARQAGIILPS